MAKVGNRVKETSATTGTGTLDLAGAPTGFRGFGDEFTSGDSVYYLCVDDVDNPTEYEYGFGTFTSGTPDTLSRDFVEGSSNGGSKVSWINGCTVISTPTAAALMTGAFLDDGAVHTNLLADGSVTNAKLANYAEGSFTPMLAGSTNAGTHTYLVQIGRYIRIGNVVTAWFNIALSALDGTATGNAMITGLPFTSRNVPGLLAPVALSQYGPITFSAGVTQITARVSSNSTTIAIHQSGSGISSSTVSITAFANTTQIVGTVSYPIN